MIGVRGADRIKQEALARTYPRLKSSVSKAWSDLTAPGFRRARSNVHADKHRANQRTFRKDGSRR